MPLPSTTGVFVASFGELGAGLVAAHAAAELDLRADPVEDDDVDLPVGLGNQLARLGRVAAGCPMVQADLVAQELDDLFLVVIVDVNDGNIFHTRFLPARLSIESCTARQLAGFYRTPPSVRPVLC